MEIVILAIERKKIHIYRKIQYISVNHNDEMCIVYFKLAKNEFTIEDGDGMMRMVLCE